MPDPTDLPACKHAAGLLPRPGIHRALAADEPEPVPQVLSSRVSKGEESGQRKGEQEGVEAV
jgi:hypothetical protein